MHFFQVDYMYIVVDGAGAASIVRPVSSAVSQSDWTVQAAKWDNAKVMEWAKSNNLQK